MVGGAGVFGASVCMDTRLREHDFGKEGGRSDTCLRKHDYELGGCAGIVGALAFASLLRAS